MENREYVIFNVSEIDKVDFSQVLETSKDTIRTSYDGSLTFIKFDTEQAPSFLKDMTTIQGMYNHEEILAIVNTQEWSKPNPKID
jgi:hypothetical protein